MRKCLNLTKRTSSINLIGLKKDFKSNLKMIHQISKYKGTSKLSVKEQENSLKSSRIVHEKMSSINYQTTLSSSQFKNSGKKQNSLVFDKLSTISNLPKILPSVSTSSYLTTKPSETKPDDSQSYCMLLNDHIWQNKQKLSSDQKKIKEFLNLHLQRKKQMNNKQ